MLGSDVDDSGAYCKMECVGMNVDNDIDRDTVCRSDGAFRTYFNSLSIVLK